MNNDEMSPIPGEWPRWLYGYAALIALFHLWANTFGTLPTLWLNSLHLGLLGSLLCWSIGSQTTYAPATRYTYHFLGAMILCGGFYPLFAEEALRARGEIMIAPDILFAAVTVLITLILCRRTTGWTIPILVLIAIAYITFLGRYADGVFHFRGLGWERVLYRYYFTGEGLFGMVGTISSSFVFMFILFSAFLLKSGGGEFIMRLARILTWRLPGGGAYVAILSSGLLGSITGSAVANAVSTGAITIPMMKREGFKPEFAAAVEAAASTGAQIVPPIMGAGAFLMAQFTAIPYATIVVVSIIPAILYYLSLAIFIFLEVRKMDLEVKNHEKPEKLITVLREGIHFTVPILFLLWLLISGYSPTFAAGGGILSVILTSWLTRHHRMGLKDILDALVIGTRNSTSVALLLVCSGLIIGSLNMTGTGVAISQMIINWSGGYLWAALLLVALASLILGLGLPVTASYVMLAPVAVPVMLDMGVGLLAAHLIIFWLSQDSNVTPPVSLTAFATAGMAGASPLWTSLHAWRIAKALYLVPILFAYTPLVEGNWGTRILIAILTLLGIFLLYALPGYLWRKTRKHIVPA